MNPLTFNLLQESLAARGKNPPRSDDPSLHSLVGIEAHKRLEHLSSGRAIADNNKANREPISRVIGQQTHSRH